MEEVEETPSAPADQGPAPQQNEPDAEKRPSSGDGDRKKWKPAELPVLPMAHQTIEETTTSCELSPRRMKLSISI